MNLPPQDPFAEGLYYEAVLPFSWSALDALPDPSRLAYCNTSNEAALRGMAALDEHVAQPFDDHGTQAHDLARVEFKLDLLLDLVGQLLTQQLILPEAVWLRIGARGVEWTCPQPPAPGSPVMLQIFLLPRYPQPLELPGTIVRHDTGPDGVRCTAAFEGCSEPVQDWLEKLVFRHHRRSIAHIRAPRAGE